MIIRITQMQKEFLLNNILQDKPELLSEITKGELINDKWQINVTGNNADEIRDLCSEMLQVAGFDEYYKLTKHGEILEELIDIFYVG